MTLKTLIISPETRERAAQLYLESSEAQHGDEELADFEADHWANLFEEAEVILEEEYAQMIDDDGELP